MFLMIGKVASAAVTTSALMAVTLASAGLDPDTAIPLSIVAGLIAGGVGYGVVRQKADAAHRRIDDLNATLEKQFDDMRSEFRLLSKTVTDERIRAAGGSHVHKREEDRE